MSWLETGNLMVCQRTSPGAQARAHLRVPSIALRRAPRHVAGRHCCPRLRVRQMRVPGAAPRRKRLAAHSGRGAGGRDGLPAGGKTVRGLKGRVSMATHGHEASSKMATPLQMHKLLHARQLHMLHARVPTPAHAPSRARANASAWLVHLRARGGKGLHWPRGSSRSRQRGSLR